MKEIQSGDIIFTSIPNYLYKKVSETTASRASHVGIAFVEEDGTCLVAESRVPRCTFTPLEDFLKRSDNGWYCVRRVQQQLSGEDISRLKAECIKRQGIWYHFGFNYDSNRQYCSKYVYEVFRSALGVEIGDLEQFRDLFTSQPNIPLTFWRLWFFGRIPWNRFTVTPASQMRSNRLLTVHASV